MTKSKSNNDNDNIFVKRAKSISSFFPFSEIITDAKENPIDFCIPFASLTVSLVYYTILGLIVFQKLR